MSRPPPRRRAGASSDLPRGIAPELLVSQVKNTAPYLFEVDATQHPDTAPMALSEPASHVLAFRPVIDEPLSHLAYFRLCLSAHYVSCATLVPTDVDNQIRHKLWAPKEPPQPSALPLSLALEMSSLVLETQAWHFLPLTTRACHAPDGTDAIHGHLGEWFTVAAAAYAALSRYPQPEAQAQRAAMLEAISAQTQRHAELFGALWRAGDGVGALRAAATIAHNFGDLDRVIEMWSLPVTDPLRRGFSHLTIEPFDTERRLRHQGRLWAAGELYKSTIDGSSMALENHRHFALRKPRGLRSHPALRVPLGPFFDAWGAEVAARLEGEALEEVIDALVHGTERMPRTQSYARALHALRAAHPALDARSASVAKSHRALLKLDRATHERRWSDAALTLLDEIPSRA